jgi:hypothetical protein
MLALCRTKMGRQLICASVKSPAPWWTVSVIETSSGLDLAIEALRVPAGESAIGNSSVSRIYCDRITSWRHTWNALRDAYPAFFVFLPQFEAYTRSGGLVPCKRMTTRNSCEGCNGQSHERRNAAKSLATGLGVSEAPKHRVGDGVRT